MIEAKFSALKKITPQEYAVRFLFGGVCTVLAGLIARHFGPSAGGLFLAFPAIFPASASLIESHEKRRKTQVGSDGTMRGRMAASVDSAGTALGCIGLAAFAFVLWKGLIGHTAWLVVSIAVASWIVVSCALWTIRRSRVFGRSQFI